ncbi:MAG TPA: hypothetical protein VKA09_10140 [Nitrososphaeraceae archaeon]|jgi:hypothetical protein|nr:hypothetical protein [Nitrososphaeraceae archaeon]
MTVGIKYDTIISLLRLDSPLHLGFQLIHLSSTLYAIHEVELYSNHLVTMVCLVSWYRNYDVGIITCRGGAVALLQLHNSTIIDNVGRIKL